MRPDGAVAVTTAHTGIVMATRDGQVLCAPGATRDWLLSYFAAPRSPQKLPLRIVNWLRALKENPETLPLVAKQEESRLTVSVVHPEAEGAVCLLLKILPRHAPRKRRTEAELTAREREVLKLLADGNSNRNIAQILGISERTAGKHVEHIFVKLRVKKRAAAAAAAVVQGVRNGEL